MNSAPTEPAAASGISKKTPEVPHATGFAAGISFGLCISGIWYSYTLMTTPPAVIVTTWSLPLAILAAGFAGVLAGSRGALRFTRFTVGLLLAAGSPVLVHAIVAGESMPLRIASFGLACYLVSLLLILSGDPDGVLGSPPQRGQIPRRGIAIGIVAVAFSAAAWIWAERNGIRLW